MTQKHIYLNLRQSYHKPKLLTTSSNLKFHLQYYLQLKKHLNSYLKKFNLYIDTLTYNYTTRYLYININFFISYLFYSKVKKKKIYLYKQWKRFTLKQLNSKLKHYKEKPISWQKQGYKKYPTILHLTMYNSNYKIFNTYKNLIQSKLLVLIKKLTNTKKPIIIKYSSLNKIFKWYSIKDRLFNIIKQIYKKYMYFFVKNISFILYDLFLQLFLLFKSGKLINQLITSLNFLFKRQINSRKIFRILKSFLTYFKSFNQIKGIKLQLKGRIRGNRRKKKLTLHFKKTSTSNLNTNLQYNKSKIKTKYGILGLQIWVISYNMNI